MVGNDMAASVLAEAWQALRGDASPVEVAAQIVASLAFGATLLAAAMLFWSMQAMS